MKKQLICICMAALLSLSLLTGCGAGTDTGDTAGTETKNVTVRLSEVTHSVFYAPQYVAMSQGFFADEGLDIKLSNGGGADKVMTAVVSGGADIGLAGPESCIYIHAQGKDDLPVIFAQLTKRDGSFLVGRSDEAFDWNDLRGKTIIGGRKGGVPEMTLEYVLKQHGIVPQEVYPGLNYGTEKPVFGELDAALKAYLDAVIKARNNGVLTTAWQDGLNALLDTYFGVRPEKFTYEGKEYTPESFAASLPIKMDDYVSIASFTHHPFYSEFIIEVPDNWMWETVYNVPLEEMMAVVDNAMANNYSIEWSTDVSEKGFDRIKAIGIIPETDIDGMEGTEAEKWGKLSAAEKEAALYKFDKPVKEKKITQEMRQIAFDNYETTDDHGMVIVGTAVDQQGNPFFKVKNSWDVRPPYDGYYYFSRPFVEYKTLSIMVNKNAVPQEIRSKLGI